LIDDKSITLQGAGIGQTVITDTTGTGWNNSLIRVNGVEGKPFRITGFTFTELNGPTAIGISGDCKRFRVDHNAFTSDDRRNAITTGGFTYGVIDHNDFFNNRIVVMDGDGHDAWKRPLGLGTADAVYIEDNVFIRNVFGNSIDANHGGRYVFRYNQVTNSSCEAHSLQNAFGGDAFARATRSYEIYHNDFTSLENGHPGNWMAIFARGGTGVIFSNRVVNASGDAYNGIIAVDNVRSFQTRGEPLGKCDGDNPLDGNTLPKETYQGYPCLDQIGRSTDHGPGNDRLPQELEPLYAWDNTLDGQVEIVYVHNGPEVERHIQEGRDFFNAPKPDYTPFTYPHPLTQDLVLTGTAASESALLDWDVAAWTYLPPTSTWRITYYSEAAPSPVTHTGIVSPTRAYTLTGLTNYEWYTVTLNTLVDATPILTDTVRVMPTDRLIYLPLLLTEAYEQ
jgi:hypothetical protein